jgi:hypothetical protein
MAVAPHRLLADTWMRIDPETVDDRAPRIRRLAKGDVIENLLPEEVEYLTHGVRPSLVEADSDDDPFKDDPNYSHVKSSAAPASTPSEKSSAK